MRKRNLTLFIAILSMALMAACVGTNKYQSYLTADNSFTVAVEKYNQWYSLATIEQQAKWKETIDPLIFRGDRILDSWYNALKTGGDYASFARELDLITSQIMMEIARAQQEK